MPLAERLQNLDANVRDGVAVGHINSVSQSGLGFLLIQLIGGFLGIFYRAANDGNSGAFSGEPLSDWLPDSAAGTRGNRALVNKTIHDDPLKTDGHYWSN